MAKLVFKAAPAFKVDGVICKPDGAGFTPAEVDSLNDSFFAWLHGRGLIYGGVTGTVMEEELTKGAA